MPLVALLLWITVPPQTVAADPARRERRLAEELWYAQPRMACDKWIAKRQHRMFDRRFGARIAALRAADVRANGPEAPFEVLASLTCIADAADMDRTFARELNAYDKRLRELEGRHAISPP